MHRAGIIWQALQLLRWACSTLWSLLQQMTDLHRRLYPRVRPFDPRRVRGLRPATRSIYARALAQFVQFVREAGRPAPVHGWEFDDLLSDYCEHCTRSQF